MSDGGGGQEAEQFRVVRPVVHLTPPVGWLNDPNGLCRHDGTYHAFYQHNPAADVWGPMHWRHATSRDLHTWQDDGIALAPDEHGAIFSGSAVCDSGGTAGFGTGAMLALFTHAGGQGQVQSLASSTDGLRTWAKYDGNPVLVPASGEKDFRDPKVFRWGSPSGQGHWVMVLAVGTRVEIYRSDDLRSWELTSSFGPDLSGIGVWECPDLFEVRVDGAGDTCWFLTLSGTNAGAHGHGGTLAISGTFDGVAFEPHDPAAPPPLVDHGPDFYAAQTFAGLPRGRTVWTAWLSSWHYALSVPSGGWRGALGIPRELDAVSTRDGYRLRQRPTAELTSLRGRCVLRHEGPLARVSLRPDDDTFAYDVAVELGPGQDVGGAVLEIGDEQAAVVTLTLTAGVVVVERRSPPGRFVADSFEQTYAAALDPEEPGVVRIVIDSTSLEVFADGGKTVVSATWFWNGVPALFLASNGDADASVACRVEVHELRPHATG
ncbi:MAG: glycoside hydrolase family 32 protein [Acidimicrobiia bacterium]|nr:glycoside hydrolase family 32 protein [Acidimicrobiia bacterium]